MERHNYPDWERAIELIRDRLKDGVLSGMKAAGRTLENASDREINRLAAIYTIKMWGDVVNFLAYDCDDRCTDIWLKSSVDVIRDALFQAKKEWWQERGWGVPPSDGTGM